MRAISSSEFQSSPDPKAGCDHLPVSASYATLPFQSSPDPKAGCDVLQLRGRVCVPTVSILTRPEGRVRPPWRWWRRTASRCFNPHPTRRPGATLRSIGARPHHTGFNPHPTRRPGATRVCSITSLPLSSFNPHPTRRPGATRQASLTQARDPRGFNPHPTRRPGATLSSPDQTAIRDRFNPHPTRRPGATCLRDIVTRRNIEFQSSPDPKAGCDHVGRPGAGWQAGFQSSPDPKAGCDRSPAAWSCLCPCCFNPHPTRRPGATSHLRSVYEPWWKFQSSPDPKAGCDVAHCHQACLVRVVSILTRPEGRVRHPETNKPINIFTAFQSSPDPKAGCDCPSRPPTPPRSSFNPHPTRRPGATLAQSEVEYDGISVSILTRPEGRVRHHGLMVHSHPELVSILTRPEGRVRRYPHQIPRLFIHVSILTRPEGRVRQDALYLLSVLRDVSILTRPEGRVRRQETRRPSAYSRRFNPHPTRRPGATASMSGCGATPSMFQSSPDPKAGCDG